MALSPYTNGIVNLISTSKLNYTLFTFLITLLKFNKLKYPTLHIPFRGLGQHK